MAVRWQDFRDPAIYLFTGDLKNPDMG